jgi:adenine-specific DNA-methyltransferase
MLPAGAGPVHLDAYEADKKLAGLCGVALRQAGRWLRERGVDFTFSVKTVDFVKENARVMSPGLFDDDPCARYDIAIANPPYFKLQKQDQRALAAAAIVHGQPNIYALFMAITASLLSRRGVMVTITPRSFATGDYFRTFRQHFFSTVQPESVHLFHSRKEAFKTDAVLQENVIIRARRSSVMRASTVSVSSSAGAADLGRRRTRTVPLAAIIHPGSRNLDFHIPADRADDEVVRFVRGWPCTLHRLGLEVSTGPVVAFRARELLLSRPGVTGRAAPLLWLQNVRPLAVRWPLPDSRKPQYIAESRESRGLLLPNMTYVVLRRFTAKEEARRLTAAPLMSGDLPGHLIGLENHLNYIHRPGGALAAEEAAGLAALLGSSLLDRYFRVSNGNTQVNAGEMRALPLPPLPSVAELGAQVRRRSLAAGECEAAIAEVLHIPKHLMRMLREDRNGQD